MEDKKGRDYWRAVVVCVIEGIEALKKYNLDSEVFDSFELIDIRNDIISLLNQVKRIELNNELYKQKLLELLINDPGDVLYVYVSHLANEFSIESPDIIKQVENFKKEIAVRKEFIDAKKTREIDSIFFDWIKNDVDVKIERLLNI